MSPAEKLTQAAVDVAHAASTLAGDATVDPESDGDGMLTAYFDADDYENLKAALAARRDAGQDSLESLRYAEGGNQS